MMKPGKLWSEWHIRCGRCSVQTRLEVAGYRDCGASAAQDAGWQDLPLLGWTCPPCVEALQAKAKDAQVQRGRDNR